jgi:hypothetical protein
MSRFVQSLVNNFVGSLFLECVISYSFITDYVLYIFFHCSYTYFYIIQEEADSPPLLTDNTRGNGHSIHARNDPHSNHHQPGRVIRGDHMDRRGRADSRDSGRRSRPQDRPHDRQDWQQRPHDRDLHYGRDGRADSRERGREGGGNLDSSEDRRHLRHQQQAHGYDFNNNYHHHYNNDEPPRGYRSRSRDRLVSSAPYHRR